MMKNSSFPLSEILRAAASLFTDQHLKKKIQSYPNFSVPILQSSLSIHYVVHVGFKGLLIAYRLPREDIDNKIGYNYLIIPYSSLSL